MDEKTEMEKERSSVKQIKTMKEKKRSTESVTLERASLLSRTDVLILLSCVCVHPKGSVCNEWSPLREEIRCKVTRVS